MSDPEVQAPANRSRVALRMLSVAALCIGFAVVTRLGYLSMETIDWDEHTFRLIASGASRGVLPYVEYWDMKPPLMFMSLGWALSAFGDTLATARAYGAACVAVIAVCVYRVCRVRHGERPALLAALLTIAACSVPAFQMTTTQHAATALVMVALVVMLEGRRSLGAMFALGVLMSLATLCRANVAVIVVVVGVYLGWGLVRPRPALHRLAVLAYVAGGLIPLGRIVWVYARTSHLDLFLFSNLSAAGSYATGMEPAPWLFVKMLGVWVEHAVNYWASFLPFLLVVLIALALLAGRRRAAGTRWNDLRLDPDSRSFVIGLFGFAMWVSMALSGGLTSHHILLVIPFGAIIACNALAATDAPRMRLLALSLAVLSLTATVLRTAPMAWDVASHWRSIEDRYPIRAAALDIARIAAPQDRVFAAEHQLVYWYLGQTPPYIAATHPSALTRESLMVPMAEHGYAPRDAFLRILDAHPRFIVMADREPSYLRRSPVERAAFAKALADYNLLARHDDVLVYIRRNVAAGPRT